jgi:hypothetical protein
MHEILRKLHRELANGVSGLTAEQTQMRRAPGSWTIQQIFEHLLLTYESTTGVVESRVAKGRPTKGSPTLTQRGGQVLVTTLGVLPKGRKAPAGVCPAAVCTKPMSGMELTERAAEALFPLDAALRHAEVLFGGAKASISHQVLGPLSVVRWRKFHLVHGEHHLRQILETRRVMGV